VDEVRKGTPVKAKKAKTKKAKTETVCTKKAETKPAQTKRAETDREIQSLDALFAEAGLTRHRREKSANVLKRVRQRILTPEELRQPLDAVFNEAENGVKWLSVPGWESESWLWHGFSTRQGGVSQVYCSEGTKGELNLGFTPEDDAANVTENRLRLAEAISGLRQTRMRTLRQIHSDLVIKREETDRVGLAASRKGDGWLSDEAGGLWAIQTADCIPVLVADRRQRVVAAFHAGWRGTVRRIVECGVGRMRLDYGSRPEDLIAAIGPGVGPCCYAVGEEVLSEFESQFAYKDDLVHEVYETDSVRTRYPMLFLTQRAPGHSEIGPSLHLDLAEANRRQLVDAGVRPDAIHRLGGCTSCQREWFFSHRASQGYAGRMMSVIGIRD